MSTAKTSLNKALKCTGKHKGTGTVAKDKIKTTATTQCSGVVPPPPAPAGCTGYPNDWVYDTGRASSRPGPACCGRKCRPRSGRSGQRHTPLPIRRRLPLGTTRAGPVTQARAFARARAEPNGTELGFVLDGTLHGPGCDAGQTTEITVCFLGDSGPGTSNNFTNDVVAAAGGNTAITIASRHSTGDGLDLLSANKPRLVWATSLSDRAEVDGPSAPSHFQFSRAESIPWCVPSTAISPRLRDDSAQSVGVGRVSTLLVPLRWKARSPQAARKKGPARCQTVTITTPAEKTWTSGLCERSWHESAHRGDVDTDAEHDHGRAIGEPPTLGRLHPYNGESSQFFARVAGLVTFLLLITIPFGIASFTLQRSSCPSAGPLAVDPRPAPLQTSAMSSG